MRSCIKMAAVLAAFVTATQAYGATPTERIVRLVLESPWAQQEDGYKSLRVEFFSKAIFGFSVREDGKDCQFHFWREERAEEMLNRAHDIGCNGTLEGIKTFARDARWQFRRLSRYEKAFYEYYLPRYAAVFEAVNGFGSQDKTRSDNRALLKDIISAATASDLMGVPRNGRAYPQGDQVIMKIWVNGGVDDDGFELGFFAEKGAALRLTECYVVVKDQKSRRSLVNMSCDGRTDLLRENEISVGVTGKEKEINHLLLQLWRFAAVANEHFQGGEAEALAAAKRKELAKLIGRCRSAGQGAVGFDRKCLVQAAIAFSEDLDDQKYRAQFLADIVPFAAELAPTLAEDVARRIPANGFDARKRKLLAKLMIKVRRFDAALEAAETIEDLKDREWLLSRVGLARAKAGEWNESEAIVRGIEDDGMRARAFRDLAREWLTQNGLSGVERFMEGALVGERRAQGLALIGVAQAKAGDLDAARETFRQALGAADQFFGTEDEDVFIPIRQGVYLYSLIAQAQFDSGLQDDALATLRTAKDRALTIERPARKANALRRVALDYAEIGMVEEALAAIDGIEDVKRKISTAIVIHDDVPEPEMSLAVLDYAVRHAEEVDDPEIRRLKSIALGLAEFGDRKGAIEVFKKALTRADTLEPEERQKQIRSIAEASAKAGIYKGAKALVKFIDDPAMQRKTLVQIGAEQWKGGQQKEAEKLFDEALRMKVDESAFGRGLDLADIVDIQARAGAIRHARETFRHLSSEKGELSYAFAAKYLVRAHLKRDDLDSAIKLFDDLEGQPGVQGQSLVSLIEHIAEKAAARTAVGSR